jgi:hypothetical protein
MLARDPLEAADQAEEQFADQPLEIYYDEVALSGLKLAQADLTRGALNAERSELVRDSVLQLVDHLGNDAGTPWHERTNVEDEAVVDPLAIDPETLQPAFRSEAPVLCIGGRSPLDEAAAAMLAHALSQRGLGARSLGPDSLTSVRLFQMDREGVALICVCYLDRRSPGSMRYAVKRLKRKFPDAVVMVGLWGDVEAADLDRLRRTADVGYVGTSLGQSVQMVREVAMEGPQAEPREDAFRNGGRRNEAAEVSAVAG